MYKLMYKSHLDLFLKQMRLNPNLVQKVVDVHPKIGNPYQALRWVRRDKEEKEEKTTREEHVESVTQAARNIFGFKPESNEEFIQQAELIRSWFQEEATQSDREEIEEKLEWIIQYSNDDEQNEITESPIYNIPREMGSGINGSVLVELDNGIEGVYKSAIKESNSFNKSIGGNQYMREVAAYKLSKLFPEFDGLVPTTALHVGKHESDIGSVQAFVPNAETYGDASDELIRHLSEEEHKNLDPSNILFKIFSEEDIGLASIFDSLIESRDRHPGNFMVNDGQLVLIDNGITLGTTPASSSLYSTFLSNKKVLNKPFDEKHKTLLQNILDKRDEVEKELSPYLAEPAISNMFNRVESMLEGGVHGLGDLSYNPKKSAAPKLFEEEEEEIISPADKRWREKQKKNRKAEEERERKKVKERERKNKRVGGQ